MSAFAMARTRAGLTILQVSDLLGLSPETAAEYEAGARSVPARELQVLKGLAAAKSGTINSAPQLFHGNDQSLQAETSTSRKGYPKVARARIETSARKAFASERIQASVAGAYSEMIAAIRATCNLDHSELAQFLGASLVSVVRWERGDTQPGFEIGDRIAALFRDMTSSKGLHQDAGARTHTFASRGARRRNGYLPLLDVSEVQLTEAEQGPLLSRLRSGPSFWGDGESTLQGILAQRSKSVPTLATAAEGGVSAGKNTYTYDAHTYHTKVPPQGIAEVIRQYLPGGGLVLDPFAGSGMTGVAALASGFDVILNELSPAACFISDHFTRQIDPALFAAGVKAVCDDNKALRAALYSTECRECGKDCEIQYTVWSYNVVCPHCSLEFLLWDHCRRYGRTVREHKILSEFPCPKCQAVLKKSRLKRTSASPVLIGYRCCTKGQVERPPSDADLTRIKSFDALPLAASGYFPTDPLPDGVNLRQPKRHGLDSVDRLYTPRNLAAMSRLWRSIHRIQNSDLAGYLGFVFTSLYQRVTRLSEYRFWGGSGNTARFNVPFIFNEGNVFVTFERKARSIQDHLETTARRYTGQCVVHTGSATRLSYMPNDSVDLIFTDPPFGGNINYSEMNFIWEAWLNSFTDNTHEAIVNRYQGKDSAAYGDLMRKSLEECYRVLRDNHWMLLVFMNSSSEIWEQLKRAIVDAGFLIERMDIFDKQHGTFKQFVSENTAGCDLILHCRKVALVRESADEGPLGIDSVHTFLRGRRYDLPRLPYLHVHRQEEVDYRMLYSEWISEHLTSGRTLLDFSSFRRFARSVVEGG